MPQPLEPVAIVTTGGTIDKAYFDALSAYHVGDTVVAKLLSIAQVTQPYTVIELFRKDSLELTAEDREKLRQTVAQLAARRVVITHGTDTMAQSAKALASLDDKTIVLTGALAPARFAESDAPFNLGMAFAAAQTLPAGVYITMNGRVIPGAKARKDREKARFVSEDD